MKFLTNFSQDAPNIQGEALFSALPDNFKKEFENIQKTIMENRDILESLQQRNTSHISRVKDDLDDLNDVRNYYFIIF